MQTSTKATPSHESNRGSRSQSGARFQLLGAKVIIFSKIRVIFSNIYISFSSKRKIRYPSIIFEEFL